MLTLPHILKALTFSSNPLTDFTEMKKLLLYSTLAVQGKNRIWAVLDCSFRTENIPKAEGVFQKVENARIRDRCHFRKVCE